MGKAQQCRFCGKETVDHDHDECAEKFGHTIELRLHKHLIGKPTKPFPKSIRDKLASDKWKWYGEYVARAQQAFQETEHGQKIMDAVGREATKILRLKSNRERITRHVTSLGETHYLIHLSVEVGVEQYRLDSKT